MGKYLELHGRDHKPGGADPIPNTIGAAAQISVTGGTLSCGGGAGSNNPITFSSVFDNIGSTSAGGGTTWSPPASFNGPNPVYGVHGYMALRPALHAGSFALWWNGPVNPVLYFPGNTYYDYTEYGDAGYQSDGYAYQDTPLTSDIYLLGGWDLTIHYITIDIVYVGQSS